MAGVDSLFLSRLILAPSSRRVWNELAHPYEMHRTLMRAFGRAGNEGRGGARGTFGLLFRADMDDERKCALVYVQSTVEPDWSVLRQIDDYLLEDPSPAKDLGAAYQRLRAGQRLAFRLRANPSRRVWVPKPGTTVSRGQRVGLCTEEEQIEWLIRKGRGRASPDGQRIAPGGFDIPMVEIEGDHGKPKRVPQAKAQSEGMRTGRKRGGGAQHEMTHMAVRFDGVLAVTDADLFRRTLAAGIGPAKAFGFGLLSIAPVKPEP